MPSCPLPNLTSICFCSDLVSTRHNIFLRIIKKVMPLQWSQSKRFPIFGGFTIAQNFHSSGNFMCSKLWLRCLSSLQPFHHFHIFFCYNETHLRYKPPKHKKKKFTALIQYKARYKDPYLQPEECKCNNNKQTNKQTFEWKIINLLSPFYQT